MPDKKSVTGLNQLLKHLAESEIDFIVIGGFAGVLYGSTLVTRDLDICTLLSPNTLAKLRQVLAPFHPKHRMTPRKLSFLTEPRSLENINNVCLETDLGVLDVLSAVKGLPSFEILKKRATVVELYGAKVNILSLSDLIETKKQMGRPKDLIAVAELEKLKE